MSRIVFDWKLPQKLLVHPVGDGYEINGSIAFVISYKGRQLRYALQDKTFLCKGCHKKALAKAAREHVRIKRLQDGLHAQEAYVAAKRGLDLKPTVWDYVSLYWRRLLG